MIKLGHIDVGFRKCVGDKIEVLVTGLVIASVTPSISDWLYDKCCHPHPKIDANLQEIRSKISVALAIAYNL